MFEEVTHRVLWSEEVLGDVEVLWLLRTLSIELWFRSALCGCHFDSVLSRGSWDSYRPQHSK
jgi:hypothetical protein